MSSHRHSKRIGYLVKTFPKISETFILQEILELERQGVSLTIFSLYPPTDTEVHPFVSDIQSRVYYLSGQTPKSLEPALHAHQWLVTHHRNRHTATLQFFQRRQEGMQPSDLHHARALAVQLLELKIDHLHAHFANEPTGVAELTHHLTGIPFSFTAHAKDIYLSHPQVLDRKMQGASFVITCTKHNKDYLENLSSGHVPVQHIYHGLDATRFSGPDLPHTHDCGSDVPCLLSVGRFREKKGFLTLIRSCHLLKTWGYTFHCRIIGYGPLQEELAQLVHDLDLHDHVALLGKMTPEEVIPHYQEAAVFLLPCQIEENGDRDGIPNVLMEAMAMRVPVITTHVSGIPELVEHQTHGLVVPPKDAMALAKATARLLDNPPLRERMGRNGREKILRDFSSYTNTEKVRDLLLDPQRMFTTHDMSVSGTRIP